MPYGILAADQIQSSVTGVSLGAGNATRFKNRIINGDMRIDQRNAGASVTLPDGAVNYSFPVDRWACSRATGATATGQQSTTVPSGQGFINSLVITNGTGISVSSTGEGYVFQAIEGLNTSDLMWGTANARTVTLSFWVQSSITGTHSGAFTNSALNRSYPFQYTISSANTWTQISVTIPGDTSGTWLTTNGRGIMVIFNNGSGSTKLTTANAWAAGNYYGVTGSVALNSVTGSTWYITGVQLEVGSFATGFEYVDYSTQLILCQRYYQHFTQPALRGVLAAGTAASRCGMQFPVVMRTAPTSAIIGTVNVFDGAAVSAISSINASYNTANVMELDFNLAISLGALRPALVYQLGTTGAITASAEL